MNLGEPEAREPPAVEERPVPREVVEVEEQRARGVGEIGGVQEAPGEPVEDPAVHGPEPRTALHGPAHLGFVLHQPEQLRRGEVGVDEEAGPRPDLVLEPFGPEALAHGHRPLALPHDCRGERPAPVVPQEERLPLVRDAAGCDRAGVAAGLAQRDQAPAQGLQHAVVDAVGRLLDEPGTGVRGGEVRRGLREHRAPEVEHHGLGAARALVDGEEGAFSHGAAPRTPRTPASMPAASMP